MIPGRVDSVAERDSAAPRPWTFCRIVAAALVTIAVLLAARQPPPTQVDLSWAPGVTDDQRLRIAAGAGFYAGRDSGQGTWRYLTHASGSVLANLERRPEIETLRTATTRRTAFEPWRAAAVAALSGLALGGMVAGLAAVLRRSGRRFTAARAPAAADTTRLATAGAWLERVPADLRLAGELAVLVLLYQQFWLVPERLGRLSAESWFQPVLFLEWVRNDQARTVLALWCGATLIGWRRLRWTALEDGRALRRLVTIVAVGLAWAYAAYDYNPYVSQWHAADRVLLAGLATLTWIHPAFVVPLLLQVRLIAEQFGGLAGAYTFTDKQIAFDVLLVFSAFLAWRLVVRSGVRAFVVLVVSMLGSHFLYSAWTKLELGWIHNESLEFLVTSSYANGWLGMLGADTIASVAAVVAAIAVPMKVAVVASELIPLLMLRGPRMFGAVIVTLLVLHVGVFALAGLLFWKWMLVEIALLVFVRSASEPTRSGLFRAAPFAFSIALMIGAPLYFRPAELGWLDTAVTRVYELEAVGRSGRVYPVSRGFMSPFDIVFSQNQFEFLETMPVVVTTYGAVSRPDVAHAINQMVTGRDPAARLAAIRASHGRTFYSEERIAAFDDFIRRFFGTLNRQRTKGEIPAPLGPPRHIWNSDPSGSFAMDEPVTEVRVRRLRLAWLPARREHARLDDVVLHRTAIGAAE